MNEIHVTQINSLRQEGKGYRSIASALGLPMNSVKSWCRRHPLEARQTGYCLYCGAEIVSTPHKRERKYCSDQCRLSWWKEHPEKRTCRKAYSHTCRCCGKVFTNNRISASYCSRNCFAKARMKHHGR